MTLRSAHRLLGMVAGLVGLLFQVYASAHAAGYDDVQHEHDGVVCVLAAVSQDEAAILSDPDRTCEHIQYETEPSAFFYIDSPYVTPPSQAPPPRGPPALIQ